MDYFSEACETYRYLRERGYAEGAALKLVGDHHRLSRVQRNCIFRGIVTTSVARARKSALVEASSIARSPLGIDWYNVLITIESHLRGIPLFLCDDGFLRDGAAAHGSYRPMPFTDRAIAEILATLLVLGPARVDVYLDSPIAHSALMAERVRSLCAELPFSVEVSLAHSADYPLKSYSGIVATSDSAIIDRAPRVLDLAACVLRRGFGFIPPTILAMPRPARE
jgi:hypothetical protein